MLVDDGKRQESLLYLISQLGTVQYDRLCELVYLAARRELLKYDFDNESGSILSSIALRKDLSDLVRKTFILEKLEKVNKDFDVATHVYIVTEYGRAMAKRIKDARGYELHPLDEFVQSYRGAAIEQIEREIGETIKR